MQYASEDLVAWCDRVEDGHHLGSMKEGREEAGPVLARLGPCVLANPMTQDKSSPTPSPHIRSRLNK